MTHEHFEEATPEDLQTMSTASLQLSEAARGGDRYESLSLATAAGAAAGNLFALSQVLDRLERILLLLDERLPTAAQRRADALEGTIEHASEGN